MKGSVAGLAAGLAALSMASFTMAQDQGEQQRPPREGGFLPSFEEMDTNKDGKVSLDEYQASMAQMMKRRFDMLDTDKDGALTAEELKAGRQPRGPRPGGDQGRPHRGRGEEQAPPPPQQEAQPQ